MKVSRNEMIRIRKNLLRQMDAFIRENISEDIVIDIWLACGLEDGCYDLGGQQVEVKGNLATLASDSATIAGSVTNLMNCLRCAVKTMKIPFASAVKAATHNPARSIGVLDDYGDVEAGKYANLLILDEELNIVHMIKRGKLVR